MPGRRISQLGRTALTLLAAAVLAACSGSPNKPAASAACAKPVASASSYSTSVLADQKAATTASADPTRLADVRADQARLQQAWAELISANEKCFPADSVAAAREYLSGPGG